MAVQDFVKCCIKEQISTNVDIEKFINSTFAKGKRKEISTSLLDQVLGSVGSYLVHSNVPQSSLPPTPITILRNSSAHNAELTKNPSDALIAVVVIAKLKEHPLQCLSDEMVQGIDPEICDNPTIMYLMGFSTRAEFYFATLSSASLETISFRSQVSLKWNIMSVEAVKTSTVTWKVNALSGPPIQAPISPSVVGPNAIRSTTSNSSTSSGILYTSPFAASPTNTNTSNGIPQEFSQTNIPYDIPAAFCSPIYVFHCPSKPQEAFTEPEVSILRLSTALTNTCNTFARIFAEWQAMLHGFSGNISETFVPCIGLDTNFGKKCAEWVQRDAEGGCIYGSVNQAMRTFFTMFHLMAQASAILILKNNDYGMRNWFMLCWAIYTKVRLTYLFQSQSCDYMGNINYFNLLQLKTKATGDWTKTPPEPFTDVQLNIVLEQTSKFNGIPWKKIPGLSERESMTSFINEIISKGLKAIAISVKKYSEGLVTLEKESPVENSQMDWYKMAIAAYAGSYDSISRLTNNSFVGFMKKTWHEKRHRPKEDIVGIELPSPFINANEFGFYSYDTCVNEEGLEKCICSRGTFNWNSAFRDTIGVNFPQL